MLLKQLRRLQIKTAALFKQGALDQQEEEGEITMNEQAKASAEANLIKAGIGVGMYTREALDEVKAISEDRTVLDGIVSDMLDN